MRTKNINITIQNKTYKLNYYESKSRKILNQKHSNQINYKKPSKSKVKN